MSARRLAPGALARAALACHIALAAAVGTGIALHEPGLIAAGAAAAAVLPLAIALPGLARGTRRGASWAAFLTVIYAAAAAMEIVATSGAAPFATVALLAALAELGTLFALSRRPQAARGRTAP